MTTRRRFISVFTTGTSLALAWAAGLAPRLAAAAWPKAAYDAAKTDETLQALFGQTAAQDSPQVKLTAPEIAENGGQVPFIVSSDLPNVDAMAIIVQENPRPLATSATFDKRAVPTLKTRLKLAKTGKVVAYVRSDGKLYSTTREVKVTLGGCGG